MWKGMVNVAFRHTEKKIIEISFNKTYTKKSGHPKFSYNLNIIMVTVKNTDLG